MTDVSTSVTVTVPFAIRKRGGRKLIITPDGTNAQPHPRVRVDSALLKALARGFRWRKLLEAGDFATIEEIADAESINPSYVSRVLRMTLLAPQIVEAIAAGRQPDGLTMDRAMKPFPIDWRHQSFRQVSHPHVSLAIQRRLLYSRENSTQPTSFKGAG